MRVHSFVNRLFPWEVFIVKKVYVTPEIEYDDFSLDEIVCANLYKIPRAGSEFNPVGGGYGGGASEPGGYIPDIGGDDGDDLF